MRSLTRTRYVILASLIFQIVLLAGLGYRRRYQINPDTVSYIRIAHYYATGQYDLAVSGYWGPMLSWLMAPLLNLIPNPLFAAHVVVGLSALVFAGGCLAIWYRMGIPPVGLMIGSWLVALTSACWSVALGPTPDLLVGGLMLLGISGLMAPGWVRNAATPISAGLLLGLAYLAKSIALPLAFLFVAGIAFLWWTSRLADMKALIRASILTLASCALVASPWIAILSMKYGKPVFSTTAAISHAIVGPENTDWAKSAYPRFNWSQRTAFRGPVGRPESGRLVFLEDPPISAYRYWSPLESYRNLLHQVKIIKYNISYIIDVMKCFDILGIGISALVLGLIVHAPWPENMRATRWRWAGVPALCIGLIYLPVYANDARYFWVTYPFLFGAAIGLVDVLTASAQNRHSLTRVLGIAIVTCSFLGVPLLGIRDALRPLQAPKFSPNESAEPWMNVAQALKEHNAAGTVVSDRETQRYAIYLCLFSQKPHFGCFTQERRYLSPNSLIDLGAELVMVARGSEFGQQLAEDGRFRRSRATSAQRSPLASGLSVV